MCVIAVRWYNCSGSQRFWETCGAILVPGPGGVKRGDPENCRFAAPEAFPIRFTICQSNEQHLTQLKSSNDNLYHTNIYAEDRLSRPNVNITSLLRC